MDFKIKESMYFGERLIKAGSVLRVSNFMASFKVDKSYGDPLPDGSGPFIAEDPKRRFSVIITGDSDTGNSIRYIYDANDDRTKEAIYPGNDAKEAGLKDLSFLENLQDDYSFTDDEIAEELSEAIGELDGTYMI